MSEACHVPKVEETHSRLEERPVASARAIEVLRLVCSQLPHQNLDKCTSSAADPVLLRLTLVCRALFKSAQREIYRSIQLEHTSEADNSALADSLSSNPGLAADVRKIWWTCALFNPMLGSPQSSMSVLMLCTHLIDLSINPSHKDGGPWLSGDIYQHLPLKNTIVALSVSLSCQRMPFHLGQFISSLSALRRLVLHRRGAMSGLGGPTSQALPDLHPAVKLTTLGIYDDTSILASHRALQHLPSSISSLKVLELDFLTGFAPCHFSDGGKHLRFHQLSHLTIGNISLSSSFDWARFFNCFPALEDLTVKHKQGLGDLNAVFNGLNEVTHFRKLLKLKIQSTSTFSLDHYFDFLTRISFQHLKRLLIVSNFLSLKQCMFPSGTVTNLRSYLAIFEPLLVLEIKEAMKSNLLLAETVFEVMRDSQLLYRMVGTDVGLSWASEEYGGDREEWIEHNHEEPGEEEESDSDGEI